MSLEQRVQYALRAQEATRQAAAARARHKALAAQETAAVIAAARELYPVIVDTFGDTPGRQHARRMALDVDARAYQAGRPLREAS